MTRHSLISYMKSAIRIAGYVLLAMKLPVLTTPVIVLVVSEVLGIAEEFGATY